MWHIFMVLLVNFVMIFGMTVVSLLVLLAVY